MSNSPMNRMFMFSNFFGSGNGGKDKGIRYILMNIISYVSYRFADELMDVGYFDKLIKIFNWFMKLFKSVSKERSIEFKFDITTKQTGEVSPNALPIDYKAMLHRLNKLNVDYNNVKLLQDNTEKYYYHASGDTILTDEEKDALKNKENKMENLDYILSENGTIKMSDDIYIRHYVVDDSISDKSKSINFDQYTIQICSKTLSVRQLTKLHADMIKEYNDFVLNKDVGGLKYITIKNNKETNKQRMMYGDGIMLSIEYKMYDLTTDKTFDNLFFEGKQKFLSRVDNFVNGYEHYKKNGIPYTLGVLAYGEPGCGKTSCIKALAKKLNRHVIELNLSEIETPEELRIVFNNQIINDTYIPIEKRIIIIEDIDCMIDTVKKRASKERRKRELKFKSKIKKQKDNSDDESNGNNQFNDDDGSDDDYSEKKKNTLSDILFTKLMASTPVGYGNDSDNKISLSFILGMLDGVQEQKGRMMYVTTNKINELDPAFIRRFGIRKEFKKCNRDIAKELLDNYYETDCDTSNITEYKYSPCDIQEHCLDNASCDELLKILN